jgi:hemolysin activation/secretion protein
VFPSPARERFTPPLLRPTLTAFAAAWFCATAQAQTPDEQLLRQREQQRQAEQAQREAARPDALKPPLDAAGRELVPKDESPCFAIARLQLDGAQAFPFLEAQRTGVEGRCLGARGVQTLQRNLQRALIERGFVTSRVLVPEQNLAAGTLRLQVVPGRVSGVEHEGTAAGLIATVLPTRGDGLLNQRDLDQAIENLRRLPSERTEIDIRPGDQLGQSQLLFKHQADKRWRLGTTLDNAGSPATGRVGASFTLNIDSPLHLYDQLTLSHNRNAQSSDAFFNRGHGLQWSVPFGYWSFSLGANRYEYLQSVAGFSRPIRYSGNSRGSDIGLGWVVQRDASSKTSVNAKYLDRASRSYIEGVEVAVQGKDTGAYDLALAHRRYLGTAVVDLSLGLRGGLAGRSPQPGVIVGAPDYDGRYRITTVGASLATPFQLGEVPLRYQGQLKAQKASRVVPPSEFFAIGNRYSVRGFSGELSLAAEHGASWRNELAWAAPWQPVATEFYAVLDAGLVRGAASEQLVGKSLAGAGLGVRARWQGAQFDLAVTQPIRQPDLFERKTAVYASLAYEF